MYLHSVGIEKKPDLGNHSFSQVLLIYLVSSIYNMCSALNVREKLYVACKDT